MAQLAEQLICNQQVNGSSPFIGLKASMAFMGGFPSGQRGQTVNLLHFASVVRIHLHPLRIFEVMNILNILWYNLIRYILIPNNAGWSSLEARRAHNPKVTGSNPVPATRCPDSSVGRAEDWKSSCHWFDSGSGHFYFTNNSLGNNWATFIKTL